MRSLAAVSAILAASTAAHAALIAPGPSTNTTVISVSPPLSTGHSVPSSPPFVHGHTTVVVPSASAPFPTAPGSATGAPIPPGNFTGIQTTATGLPPAPTASNTGISPIPIAGAPMNAQNSFLAMGVAMVMAVLTL
ncbi:hypothetical protein E4U54_004511 [Claviceps lovelessii]|nr:hypothetical protein E4U54_004511 [Claviceps lovelessii]